MKICLCGSTRFRDDYELAERQLALAGYTVYSVSTFDRVPENDEFKGTSLSSDDKIVLDLVHMKKILESDAILIVGTRPSGTPYLGASTSREFMWALMNKKAVYTMDDLHHLTEHNPSARATYEHFSRVWAGEEVKSCGR